MTKRRDLGPILAIAGSAIAAAAIVAGFIIVGGPGHARDNRLDQLTSQRISQVVGVIQCAFDTTGIAAIDYATATKTRSVGQAPGVPPAMCDGNMPGAGGSTLEVGQGDMPAKPGDITYTETGPTQVKVCGNFHTASGPDNGSFVYPYSDVYPILADSHAAGVHCYVLDLVKSGFNVPFEEKAPPIRNEIP